MSIAPRLLHPPANVVPRRVWGRVSREGEEQWGPLCYEGGTVSGLSVIARNDLGWNPFPPAAQDGHVT